MRNLASVQRILSLEEHPNAQFLEIAKVLGWTTVIKKNDFKVNDKVIYIETDSILPDSQEFEFLKPRGFRIKTIRLRGVISQGICFPLSILTGLKFPDDTRENPIYDFKEGMDVSSLIGVKKYDPPVPAYLSGEVAGNFPSFMPKSDETRVQILQRLLTKYKGTKCFISEKLDGSSASYSIYENQFYVCSRNLNLKLNDANKEKNVFVKQAVTLKIEEKLRSLNKNVAIQGELFGKGIQNNNLELDYQTIRFFNVFDINEQKYYDLNEFKETIKQLGLETVPILSEEFELIDDIDKLIKLAEGTSVLSPKIQREGIVIRPVKEIRDFDLKEIELIFNRISFKAINPLYLLEFEE